MNWEDTDILFAVEKRFYEIGFFDSEKAIENAVLGDKHYRETLCGRLRAGHVMINIIDRHGFHTKWSPPSL